MSALDIALPADEPSTEVAEVAQAANGKGSATAEPEKTPERNTLWTALLAFQAEAPSIQKDKLNPAFRSKYAGLDTVVAAVKPLLTKHGLLWITMPTTMGDGEPALAYRLAHAATGEAITGVMRLMLAKNDPQGQGSAITYARRYSELAVLDLVADEDDDGNAASKRQTAAAKANGHANGVTADPVQPTRRPATAKQRGLINARAQEAGLDSAQMARALLGVAGLEPRTFDSPEAAQSFVGRQLDRLPADLVNPLLAAVKVIAEEEQSVEEIPF